jgi:hypothetical protein
VHVLGTSPYHLYPTSIFSLQSTTCAQMLFRPQSSPTCCFARTQTSRQSPKAEMAMQKHIGNREWISQCLLILITKETEIVSHIKRL